MRAKWEIGVNLNGKWELNEMGKREWGRKCGFKWSEKWVWVKGMGVNEPRKKW